VDARGLVKAAVVYDGWTKNACEAHVCIDSPVAGRALLPHALVYPFQHVGVLLGSVPASNQRALRLDKHLGFREVGRVKDGWDSGVDLVRLELRREDCRFLKDQAYWRLPEPHEPPAEANPCCSGVKLTPLEVNCGIQRTTAP
jgi:hypothetical protein